MNLIHAMSANHKVPKNCSLLRSFLQTTLKDKVDGVGGYDGNSSSNKREIPSSELGSFQITGEGRKGKESLLCGGR